MPADIRFRSDGKSATRCRRSSLRLLRLHAPDEILECRDRLTPRLALLAVGKVDALERFLPVLAQEDRQEVRDRIRLDPALDLGARDGDADLAPVVLVDLLGGRLDVRLGRLLLLGEERLQLLAQLVEDREVVGKSVEDLVDDAVDRLVKRIVLPHHRRPAEARLRQRVDQEPRRMRLLREERAVEHRRLQHRNLQARERCLDAVGEVAGLEDEVEQHRHQLDRHRFELVDALAERRLLQVAQHVVLAFRDARELDEHPAAQVESALARLQPREAFAQLRRRDDRRARLVARRRRRKRTARDVASAGAAGAHLYRRVIAAARGRSATHVRHLPAHLREAGGHSRNLRHLLPLLSGADRARIHAPEQRHHVHLGRRRFGAHLAVRPRPARAIRRPAAIDDRRPRARRDHVQRLELLVEIGIHRGDVTERSLVQLLHDRGLDALLGLDRLQRLGKGDDERLRAQADWPRSRGRDCRRGARWRD